MDAHSGLKRIAAILFVYALFCCPLFAGSIFTYKGGLILRIPTELDGGKGRVVDAAINFGDSFTFYKIGRGITLNQAKVFRSQFFPQASQVFEMEKKIRTLF